MLIHSCNQFSSQNNVYNKCFEILSCNLTSLTSRKPNWGRRALVPTWRCCFISSCVCFNHQTCNCRQMGAEPHTTHQYRQHYGTGRPSHLSVHYDSHSGHEAGRTVQMRCTVCQCPVWRDTHWLCRTGGGRWRKTKEHYIVRMQLQWQATSEDKRYPEILLIFATSLNQLLQKKMHLHAHFKSGQWK